MNQPDFAGAQQYALGRLEAELPPTLFYHNLRHTRDDVLPAVIRLATMEGIGGEKLDLLRTAAIYHDLGFVEQYKGHEAASMRIAADVLPSYGFRPDQVFFICNLILVTVMPQRAQTICERLLCDADLDVLGREDFLDLNRELHRELRAHGAPVSEREWYQDQLAFLEGHTYFTASANHLRNEGKQWNIVRLKERLNMTG